MYYTLQNSASTGTSPPGCLCSSQAIFAPLLFNFKSKFTGLIPRVFHDPPGIQLLTKAIPLFGGFSYFLLGMNISIFHEAFGSGRVITSLNFTVGSKTSFVFEIDARTTLTYTYTVTQIEPSTIPPGVAPRAPPPRLTPQAPRTPPQTPPSPQSDPDLTPQPSTSSFSHPSEPPVALTPKHKASSPRCCNNTSLQWFCSPSTSQPSDLPMLTAPTDRYILIGVPVAAGTAVLAILITVIVVFKSKCDGSEQNTVYYDKLEETHEWEHGGSDLLGK